MQGSFNLKPGFLILRWAVVNTSGEAEGAALSFFLSRRVHDETVVLKCKCTLDCFQSGRHWYPAIILRLVWRVIKAWRKKRGKHQDQECIIAKGQVVGLLKRASYVSSPTLCQPACIMLQRWCHIDYADRKPPLFVPSSLPSVIHLQGWAEVTLKAIFSMFSAFSGHAADNASPTGGPGDPSVLSHYSILIAF